METTMNGISKEDLDEHLMYAARSRCRCGAGLAYLDGVDLDHPMGRSWYCSEALFGLLNGKEYETVKSGEMFKPGVARGKHDSIEHDGAYPFAFYEIKSEIQPSQGGATTRPKGLVYHKDCGQPCYKCKCSTMRETEVR